MTVHTADHRATSTCACGYRRLREIDRLLTEARDHVLDATAALEDPADACRAVELLRLAGRKRADAHEEARAGLAAMSDQPVSDQPVSDQPASDQPASDQPASDQPASDQPASDG